VSAPAFLLKIALADKFTVYGVCESVMILRSQSFLGLHINELQTNHSSVDIKEIRALIDLMKKNGLAVFKMEKEGFKITLQMAGSELGPVVYQAGGYASQPQSAPVPQAAPAAIEAPAAPAAGLAEIVSPMVGTFYTASSPEASAYVSVGDTVTPDTVVCIIEAMKVMNEIKAEVAGTIVEIAADNGKPVQFGQALFRVK